jgi:outer membrane protein insertion porin family
MNIKILKKLLLVFFLFIFLLPKNLYANEIKDIIISGNNRISDETIKTFLSISQNSVITNNLINQTTKELFDTNFFNDISIELKDNILYLTVSENPIIQNVIFNGIKSQTILKEATNGTKLTDRSSFVEVYAKQDLDLIFKNLKNQGYYFPKINTKIEYLANNAVNLIYEIDIGSKAKINKITFTGNKIFKDRLLRSLILSEEYRFWKFISGKKFLNENLVELDTRLLKNYYLNQGYYNAQINSSYAKLVDNSDNEFELIFNIDAGKKIFFQNFEINLPLNYDKNNFLDLKNKLSELKNTPYSINAIEKIIDEIDILALEEEYESIDVKVQEQIIDNKLNLTLTINETEKFLVKKINILGNNVTRENVIRNNFEIDEGDIFNEILFNKSINNIKSLNFFKKVESEILSDGTKNEKIINIAVEESPTGEIGASAGVGTSGESFGIFIRENNYLGKGLSITSDLNLSSDRVSGSLLVNNPNFKDTDKSVYGSIEATEIDRLSTSGYKTNRTGFSYGTVFELYDDFNFGIGNKNFYEKIETDTTASTLQKKQEGDYLDSFVNLDFIYDKRNQKFKPSDGFRTKYSIDMPIISDNNTLTNTFDYKMFTELYETNITSLGFYFKTSNSITNDNVKLTERNFLPASKLRGFQAGSVGPKDGNDYIGGNYSSSLNLSSTLPSILQESENLDFLIFLDAGNVWGVDYDSSINSSNKIRSSTGLAVDWFTPIGPLNFVFSQPLSKSNSDKTESFRFNLGTTF